MKIEKIILPVLAAFLISNVSLSAYLVSRSFKAQTQRDAQVKREVETQEYIKCIVLLQFDIPAEQLKTRDGAEAALNTCVKR